MLCEKGEEAEEERRLKAIQDEVERSAQRRIAAAIADAEVRLPHNPFLR